MTSRRSAATVAGVFFQITEVSAVAGQELYQPAFGAT
jgi:hypothetical protein